MVGFKKYLAGFLAAWLLLPGVPVYAASAEGEIISVADKGPGLWKVSLQTSKGEQAYMLSMKSALKKEVPVEDIKQGDHLLPPGGGQGLDGFKGIKAPFGNMSQGTKKALGLPDVPNIPAIPKIPKLPPKVAMKGNPAAGGGAGPAPGGAPGSMPEAGPGGAPGKAKAPKGEEPKVKTKDEMLEEAGFENQKLLFPAGKEGAGRPGHEVLQVKKTEKGFELTVAEKQGKSSKLTVAPGKKVLKALTPADLKAKDHVRIDFDEQGKVIRDLTVQ